jgi:hypothetical protein
VYPYFINNLGTKCVSVLEENNNSFKIESKNNIVTIVIMVIPDIGKMFVDGNTGYVPLTHAFIISSNNDYGDVQIYHDLPHFYGTVLTQLYNIITPNSTPISSPRQSQIKSLRNTPSFSQYQSISNTPDQTPNSSPKNVSYQLLQ